MGDGSEAIRQLVEEGGESMHAMVNSSKDTQLLNKALNPAADIPPSTLSDVDSSVRLPPASLLDSMVAESGKLRCRVFNCGHDFTRRASMFSLKVLGNC